MGDNAIIKVIKSIRSRGFLTTLRVFISLIIDLLFDIKYGTDTMRFVELEKLELNSSFRDKGNDYIPTRSKHLRKIFKMGMFSEESSFVDLGSGKGRTLLIASEYFKKVKGIEFSEELCEIAKKNIVIYNEKRKDHSFRNNIQVIYADVTDYNINDEENVFFMYNPFDETVLKKFLKNIEVSINKTPRTVWIIYYYPLHRDIIDKSPTFIRERHMNMDGIECIIYKAEQTCCAN
jgi:SAM-dependent methyltransferase